MQSFRFSLPSSSPRGESGVSSRELSGTIQNDILKEFLVRNTYVYPPQPSMRIVSDVIGHVSREMPRFNAILDFRLSYA
ncbi:MAG: methylmalonyl-CoA mutase family protein [Methylovirgula sp.]